jgi:hypothetical protein
MARVVIYARDKEPSADPVEDAWRWERGMVVDILPDGRSLGKKGDVDPRFRVLDLPGVAVDALVNLREGDKAAEIVGPPKQDEREVLRRRVRKLDVAALDAIEADPVKKNELKNNPVRARLHLLSVVRDMPARAAIRDKRAR